VVYVSCIGIFQVLRAVELRFRVFLGCDTVWIRFVEGSQFRLIREDGSITILRNTVKFSPQHDISVGH